MTNDELTMTMNDGLPAMLRGDPKVAGLMNDIRMYIWSAARELVSDKPGRAVRAHRHMMYAKAHVERMEGVLGLTGVKR